MLDSVKQKIQDRLQLKESYRAIFESENPHIRDHAQRVLRHLCRVGFVSKSTFVKGDPHETALNEGSRRIVLSILKFTHKDENQLIHELQQQFQDSP